MTLGVKAVVWQWRLRSDLQEFIIISPCSASKPLASASFTTNN